MVNMMSDYLGAGYNKNNTPITVEDKEEKLIRTITRMSHGRLREDVVKNIVSALDIRRSYHVEILRSRKNVKDFLTERTEITKSLDEEKETVIMSESFESNMLVLGCASFGREVKEVTHLTESVREEKITTIKETEEHSVKQPFVVVKVKEVYIMNKHTVSNQETYVGHILGIYY